MVQCTQNDISFILQIIQQSKFCFKTWAFTDVRFYVTSDASTYAIADLAGNNVI